MDGARQGSARWCRTGGGQSLASGPNRFIRSHPRLLSTRGQLHSPCGFDRDPSVPLGRSKGTLATHTPKPLLKSQVRSKVKVHSIAAKYG